jgi:hypothetical protein
VLSVKCIIHQIIKSILFSRVEEAPKFSIACKPKIGDTLATYTVLRSQSAVCGTSVRAYASSPHPVRHLLEPFPHAYFLLPVSKLLDSTQQIMCITFLDP